MAGNNIEWTSEQMIENANNWSLAGDVALLNRLKKFSESLLSETVSVSANVDNLLNNLENVSLKLDLTKNEFQSLRNTQFIENRVYEDDETLEDNENKKEEKELTEEEKENAIKESIVTGLKVMEKYFEKIEVAMSDSEEEDNEKSYILQPKDPYVDRPLPYLVGTQDWYKNWHVGLLPSESESESEKEEEIYSSSDSEERLPKDKILGSETSSELDFTNRNSEGPVANSTFNDSQDRRREVFHSSDESSEQSNSLPAKAPLSNEKFAEQLAAKLGDVISGTGENMGQVNRNPIKKMNQATKYGNLFSDEPPPLDDFEDTVLPKSAHEGLFSGGRDLFADNNEEDVFWGQQSKIDQNNKDLDEKEPLFSNPSETSKPKVSKGLFDKSDSSSEDDMFTVAEKKKVKTTQPYLQPFKTTMPFVDDQPPDIKPKSDSVPSKKKPVGGVSIFGENANIFGESSSKPGFENTTKTTTPSQTIQESESKLTKPIKKSSKKTSLFDESSDEDEITPKNKNVAPKKLENQQTIKKLSLFDDDDTGILPPKTQDTVNRTEGKKKLSLFGDDDDDNDDDQVATQSSKKEDNKKSDLFVEDTYQNIDLFKPTTKEITDKTKTLNKTGTEAKKPVKKISLFDDDDDDDFLKEEENIFASVPKKKSLVGDLQEKSTTKPSKGLFEDSESSEVSTAEEIHSNKLSKGLFDDLEVADNSTIESNLEKNKDDSKQILSEEKLVKGSTKGLFDDLETSGSSEDLFGISKHHTDSRSSKDEENLERREVAKEGETQNKNEVTERLFEDIENSASSREHNKEDINGRSLKKEDNLVKDNNTSLDGKVSEGKPIKSATEDLGKSGKEESLFKNVDVGETRRDSLEKVLEKSGKGLLENEKVGFKQKGTSLFEDSGEDFFKNEKEEPEDLFSFQRKSEENIVEKTQPSVLKKNKEDNEENNMRQDDLGVFKSGNLEEEIVDTTNVSNQDLSKTSSQTEDVSKPSNLFEKIRKNVGFLDSDNEDDSNDEFDFDKRNKGDNVTKIDNKDSVGEVEEKSLFTSEEPKILSPKGINIAASFNEISSEINYHESPPKHDEASNENISKNYTTPPPLDLFDPNPPPPDPNWDIASDNSGESDTFSLTDGILDRANFTQSQARSSLFDEAPPSLDVNESSGIVRDINATRVEADDSSFYPYASSSRRLSSEIFGEQQSQDSFFVTKNRTEASAQPGASLGKIPENISSKIENLTPSGNFEDFEGSSVFERSKNGSKDSENESIVESKIMPQEDSLFGKEITNTQREEFSVPKMSINVRKSANLFERKDSADKDDDANKKTDSSPTKTSPGKLKHNLNINVGALIPGAARPKIRPPVVRSSSNDETDKSTSSDSPKRVPILGPPLVNCIAKSQSEIFGETDVATTPNNKTFENVDQTHVLQSATKGRVRIPVKRRPSTRKARQEAVRKSMTDFSLYHSEESSSFDNEESSESDKVSQEPPRDETNNFIQDSNNKLEVPDGTPKNEILKDDFVKSSDNSSEMKGISLVFDKNNEQSEQQPETEKISENPVSKGLFDDLSEDTDLFKPKSKEIPDTENDIFESVPAAAKLKDVLEPDDVASQSLKVSEAEKPEFETKIIEDSLKDSLTAPSQQTGGASSEISRKTIKDTNIFGSDESDSSDKDLFSNTSKSLKKEDSSASQPTKKEIPSKTDLKPSIFSDKSDSEGDSELFKAKSKTLHAKAGKKMISEALKKASLFDDSGDSSDEDLFGSKTSKSRSGDFSEYTGSILTTRRVESRNVKIANVKKLENKEVTDFDPLSAP